MIKEIKNELLTLLSSKLSVSDSLTNINMVNGGSICDAFSFQYAGRNFFCKTHADVPEDLFFIEYKSLEYLKGRSSYYIPELVGLGKSNGFIFLCMEFLTVSPEPAFWAEAGAALADLHKNSNKQFGFDYSNYMGSVRQSNTWTEKFPVFYINNRLIPMVKICYDEGLLGKIALNKFDRFYRELDSIIPEENASLIHGDFWMGNLLFTDRGVALIDPSVSYSHREVDLAMSKLFGGFNDDFYRSYNEKFPLEKDWESRVNWYNLYPLLIHLHLFGESYKSKIEKIIADF